MLVEAVEESPKASHSNPLSKRRKTHEPSNTTLNRSSLAADVERYLYMADEEKFLVYSDTITFWKNCSADFCMLAPLALRYLALPASSASAERLFSMAGVFSRGNSSRIMPDLLEAKALARYNKHFV